MAYMKSKSSSGMSKALGKMVGLLLSLYVFDEVIDAIMPSVWCRDATYPILNTTTTPDLCHQTTNNLLNVSVDGGVFGTAVTFTSNLFPVIGILGAFEIIYGALKSARLV